MNLFILVWAFFSAKRMEPFHAMKGGRMTDYCIVVTGGGDSRFFLLESAPFPEIESSPKLVECERLVHPEKGMAERELYTDSKTGRGRAPHGGPAHGYDDHRSQHEEESDRRFAHKVVKEARRFAREKQARCVVVVAPARMMGLFRQDLNAIRENGIRVQELAKDMSKFSSRQIHNYLAKEALVPACRTPRGKK
jgi:protein required for attachment to host cells